MKDFSLVLRDSIHFTEYKGVSSFVGEDISGSFGILSGHARFMTSLVMGLSRFRIAQGQWQYIATPGALLYFKNNELVILSRHFLVDENYMRISSVMEEQFLVEQSQLKNQKQSFRRIEEEVLKRLWDVGRGAS